MPVVSARVETAFATRPHVRTVAIARIIAAVYDFHQYVQRSSPSVTMLQLSEAFGLSTLAADNAINKEAAETKRIHSEVAGDRDIVVAPDLEAGLSKKVRHVEIGSEVEIWTTMHSY